MRRNRAPSGPAAEGRRRVMTRRPLRVVIVGAATRNKTAVARFADGTEFEVDAVIGADGIRSAIRSQLFGADQPRFTEMMCWRAMVPMACVPTKIGPGGSVTLERGEYLGWIGPNGHVICYPIGNGDTLNIFAG